MMMTLVMMMMTAKVTTIMNQCMLLHVSLQNGRYRSLLKGFPESCFDIIEGFLNCLAVMATKDYDQAILLYTDLYG